MRTLRALFVMALVLGPACTRSDGPGEDAVGSWAAEAEDWIEAFSEAAVEGDVPGGDGRARTIAEGAFYSPDVVLDVSNLDGHRFQGRFEVLSLLEAERNSFVRRDRGAIYLDEDAFVRTEADVYPGGDPTAIVITYTVDPGVGVTYLLFHGSNWTAPEGYDTRPESVEAQPIADEVARRYVRAWADADTSALRELYVVEATLRDTTHGIDVSGRDSILALADPDVTVPAELQRMADLFAPDVLAALGTPTDAPAVHVALSEGANHQLTEVLLLQRSVEPCPGASAVLLQLDARQRITAERRFQEIESVRECGGPDVVGEGWWSGLELPGAERVTGIVESVAGPIEVRNGTPELQQFVEWALGRFEQAGLEEPNIAAVIFDPYDAACAQFRGYADWAGDATNIVVCADAESVAWAPPEEESACPDGDCPTASPSKRNLLLHEFAHAWLHTELAAETRTTFQTHVGVETWDDASAEWADRGIEWAAETLAWGLDGVLEWRPILGEPPCSVLAEGFRILTGTDPLTACP